MALIHYLYLKFSFMSRVWVAPINDKIISFFPNTGTALGLLEHSLLFFIVVAPRASNVKGMGNNKENPIHRISHIVPLDR